MVYSEVNINEPVPKETQFIRDLIHSQGSVRYLYTGDDIKMFLSKQMVFVGNVETWSISLKPIFIRFL